MTEADALRAAINVLRDSVESALMPSGIALTADAALAHERAARLLETRLASPAQPWRDDALRAIRDARYSIDQGAGPSAIACLSEAIAVISLRLKASHLETGSTGVGKACDG